MSYAAKMVMHAKLAKGGSLYVSELTDFPGVQIMDTKDTRNSKTVRLISYEKQDFKTLSEAVEAWLWDHPESLGGQIGSIERKRNENKSQEEHREQAARGEARGSGVSQQPVSSDDTGSEDGAK